MCHLSLLSSQQKSKSRDCSHQKQRMFWKRKRAQADRTSSHKSSSSTATTQNNAETISTNVVEIIEDAAQTNSSHACQSNGNDNYLYDVNISCHIEQMDWVEKYLLPILETKLQLRCFLFERDRPTGVSPSQTIEESVNHSRQTIVCFSHQYTVSSWKQYEVVMAHHLDPNGKNMRIIPLVLDDSPIPTKFCGLSFLQWPPEETDEFKLSCRLRFFWMRLLRSLDVDEATIRQFSDQSKVQYTKLPSYSPKPRYLSAGRKSPSKS